MADWIQSFYESERARFERWVSTAKVKLAEYGVREISSYVIFQPGGPIGAAAYIQGVCGDTSVYRFIDAALAYSFGEDWDRFCRWFTGYRTCRFMQPSEQGPEDYSDIQFARRWVDPVKANATAKALRKIV